jgi:hypothetical protein
MSTAPQIYSGFKMLRRDMTAEESNAAYEHYVTTKNEDYFWASISPEVREGIWQRDREQKEASERAMGWFIGIVLGLAVTFTAAGLLLDWLRG